MKVRNGFVSNSSSSSFIIDSCDLYNFKTGEDYTPEDIFYQVKKMIQKYRDNGIKNARKEAEKAVEEYKKWDYDTTVEEQLKSIIQHYERFSDDAIDSYIKVAYIKDENDDNWLDYWYAKRSLSDNNIIIMDTVDNFISEKLAKKIIKKYNVGDRDYHLHMG